MPLLAARAKVKPGTMGSGYYEWLESQPAVLLAAQERAGTEDATSASALHMPDVSEFQTSVDWGGVKHKNGGAAIIRVAYGTRIDNLYAQGRRAAARAAGIRALGLYQYIRHDVDVLVQAAAFIRAVGSLGAGEFAVMDLEEGTGGQLSRALLWLNAVDAGLSAPKGYAGSWLYSYPAFTTAHGLNPVFESPRPCWLADYTSREPGSPPHSLWQHSNGTVDRCEFEPWSGNTDCSRRPGTLKQFLARIGGQPVPPASTTEADMFEVPIGFPAHVTVPLKPGMKTIRLSAYADTVLQYQFWGRPFRDDQEINWTKGPLDLTIPDGNKQIRIIRTAVGASEPVLGEVW